ncbi:MAG: aminoglycoside phosphotransferase family protein [Bryobacterales bacterium]|nr:aminoglycoside phosphotransferase family protein [Bryobacterales bacterium]
MLNPTFRSQLSKAFAEGLVLEGVNVRPMRRRPGSRHVFSCTLLIRNQRTTEKSSIELIGKRDTTRAAGKAAREFEAMRLLSDAGFGTDERFGIPRPAQLFPDLHVILQRKARGSKLRTHVGKGNNTSMQFARMAGLWLAKLHSLKVSSPQVCTYAHDIASARMFVTALSADQPILAVDFQRCAAAVEQQLAGFQGVPATMVHGDFHPDHIFVEKGRVTVIDFERFCLGDPARDLGSFIAHARTMACCCGRTLAAAQQDIDAFLEGYLSAAPVRQGVATASRIAPYATLSSLEALYYVASVLKVVDSGRIAMYMDSLRESELPAVDFAAPLWVLQASLPCEERIPESD